MMTLRGIRCKICNSKAASLVIMLLFFMLLLALLSPVPGLFIPANHQSDPTVILSYGTFQGASTRGMDRFLGMPFAQAERFGLPRPPANVTGIQQATAFGAACPQQGTSDLTTSEDCLFINVIRPSNIASGDTLPVLFWIFGGGYEFGDTSSNDGSTVVDRSIVLGVPVIYVSANYRLNAFGFLASSEVKAAGVGNLGLRDQRFAMQWIQDNIANFGGDASKVIIWGQSAGAISVGLHLLINSGNPAGLFRGAFMESGGPMPLPDMDTAGQPFYDQLVANTNCSSSEDTFGCLKDVPFQTLQNAVIEIPSINSFMSLHLAWRPLVDGVFLAENPLDSVSRGAYARVPIISGNCDDEGTLFSLTQLNLTSDQEAVDYLHSNLVPSATDEQFQPVTDLYPSDPTQGCPFDTGLANQLTPEYKRISAVQGDIFLQAPRRAFIQTASTTQDTWGFLFKRGKATPKVGAAHGSDIPEFYGTGTPDFQGTDALINFANTLDPNTPKSSLSTLIPWPKYSVRNASGPPLLTFLDPNSLTITPDTYRAAGMEALTALFPYYV